MSKSFGDDDDLEGVAFQSQQRRAEFWQELEALISKYPETTDGFKTVLEGEVDILGREFDPNEPFFIQGMVLILSVRNADDWESFVTLDPGPQSAYMTSGLIAEAWKHR